MENGEGIFAGPSSGAVLEIALQTAATMKQGKIVIILADGGWKYLSEDHWMTRSPLYTMANGSSLTPDQPQ